MKHVTQLLTALTLILAGGTASASWGWDDRGFMARLTLGAGYTDAAARIHDTSVTASGGTVSASLSLGGFVTPNLALTVDLSGILGAPDGRAYDDELGQTDGRATLTHGAVGAGLTYYVRPVDVFFAASLGGSLHTVEVHDAAGEVGAERGNVGISTTITVGKEWQIADDWGLGVAAHGTASTFLAGGSFPHVLSGGIAVTATFH